MRNVWKKCKSLGISYVGAFTHMSAALPGRSDAHRTEAPFVDDLGKLTALGASLVTLV